MPANRFLPVAIVLFSIRLAYLVVDTTTTKDSSPFQRSKSERKPKKGNKVFHGLKTCNVIACSP